MNDPLPHELVQDAPAGTYLVDAYEDWAVAEGMPVHTGAAVHLTTATVAPWPRFGASGAFCHVDGRCDFLSVFLREIAPGAAADGERHLYEEICYVVSGTGETEIEGSDGRRLVSWRPHSLFSMPMNARYRHRNTGSTPARIAAVNDMRYLFNLFRNEQFVFAMPLDFPERARSSTAPVAATGIAGPRLEANAIDDLANLPMGAADRSPLPSRLPLSLCDGTIAADLWHLPPATYTESMRQFQGVHMIVVSGAGYSLVSEDASANALRVDWQPGDLFSAPQMMFYQHFNAGTAPVRLVTFELGSVRHPMFRHRRVDYGDNSVYAAGRAIVPYRDQDAKVRSSWEREIAGKGLRPAI